MPVGVPAVMSDHLYLGALSVWAEEQDSYSMIADLHTLTIPENVNADDLRARIREIVARYVACGLDPDRSVILRQSDVSLDDPSIKMSKSLAGLRDGHAIGLLDPPKKIQCSVVTTLTR